MVEFGAARSRERGCRWTLRESVQGRLCRAARTAADARRCRVWLVPETDPASTDPVARDSPHARASADHPPIYTSRHALETLTREALNRQAMVMRRSFHSRLLIAMVLVPTLAAAAEDPSAERVRFAPPQYPPRLKRSESFLGMHFDFHAGPDCQEVGKRTTRESIDVSIRCPRPASVLLQPGGRTLENEYREGRLQVTVPRVAIHDIIDIQPSSPLQ